MRTKSPGPRRGDSGHGLGRVRVDHGGTARAHDDKRIDPYFSRELTTEGSPGSDPEDGDLIYFAPWGNLGFYYNADGIEYSDATIHIGTYTATADQLALLEGGTVTIDVIDE